MPLAEKAQELAPQICEWLAGGLDRRLRFALRPDRLAKISVGSWPTIGDRDEIAQREPPERLIRKCRRVVYAIVEEVVSHLRPARQLRIGLPAAAMQEIGASDQRLPLASKEGFLFGIVRLTQRRQACPKGSCAEARSRPYPRRPINALETIGQRCEPGM